MFFKFFKKFSYIVFALIIFLSEVKPTFANNENSYWQIQSVDTMKFSRDLAREKSNDESFNKVIDEQTRKIAEVGATHVAIATPYDEEFLPFLRAWVLSARNNNLSVWFRGNFSGWEGWFDYPLITKEEHLVKTRNFIQKYHGLFQKGDIFTPCTECENGSIGDPRGTGEISGFRNFLIELQNTSSRAFESVNKDVSVGYFSMNADVARLVMDKPTTKALGGVVVIDHYVKTPEQLNLDVEQIAARSEGKIILGELGIPIPDIHGFVNSSQQTLWLSNALDYLANNPELIGLNYWVGFGGTTSLWNDDASEKPTVAILRSYFKPAVFEGMVVDELKRPIEKAEVLAGSKLAYTDEKGNFKNFIVPAISMIEVKAKGFKNVSYYSSEIPEVVVLEREKENAFFKIQKTLFLLLENFKVRFLSLYFP